MKLTITQLRRIIKEEVKAVRSGSAPVPSDDPDEYNDTIVDYRPEEDALYEALEGYMNAMCTVEDARVRVQIY